MNCEVQASKNPVAGCLLLTIAGVLYFQAATRRALKKRAQNVLHLGLVFFACLLLQSIGGIRKRRFGRFIDPNAAFESVGLSE